MPIVQGQRRDFAKRWRSIGKEQQGGAFLQFFGARDVSHLCALMGLQMKRLDACTWKFGKYDGFDHNWSAAYIAFYRWGLTCRLP